MEPHDIYYVLGIFLPLIGVIGYLTARIERSAIWFPMTLFCLGLVSLGMAWMKSGGDLTISGYGDSALRIIGAIL
jgi:hypothetical protein